MKPTIVLAAIALALLASFTPGALADSYPTPLVVLVAQGDDATIHLAAYVRLKLGIDNRYLVIGESLDGLHLHQAYPDQNRPELNHVDLLLILDGQHAPLSAIIIDPAQGIVLRRVPIPDAAQESQATTVIDALKSAAAQQQAPPDASRLPLSFAATHNVDLPPDSTQACENIGAALQQQLCASRRILLLEREQLGLINALDAQISPIAQPHPLRGASRVLKLDIARAQPPSPGITATVTVCDPQGKALQTISTDGDLNSPGTLATALSAKLFAALPAISSAAPSAQAEADQFESEANLAIARADWPSASRDADAAQALAPSLPHRILLIRALIHDAVLTAFPGADRDFVADASDWRHLDTALTKLRRGTLQLRALPPTLTLNPELQDTLQMLHAFVRAAVSDEKHVSCRADARGLYHPPLLQLTPSQCLDLSSVVTDYRDFVRQQYEPAARAAVHDVTSQRNYSQILIDFFNDECHTFTRTSRQYTDEVLIYLPRWAKLEAKFNSSAPIPGRGMISDQGGAVIQIACSEGTTNGIGNWTPPCWHYDADDCQRLNCALLAVDAARIPWSDYIPENLRLRWRPDFPLPPKVELDARKGMVLALLHSRPQPTRSHPPAAPPRLLYTDPITLLDRQANDSDLLTMTKPVLRDSQLLVLGVTQGDGADTYQAKLLQLSIDGREPRKELSHLNLKITDPRQTPDSQWYYDDLHVGDHYTVFSDDRQLIVLPMTADGIAKQIDSIHQLPAPELLQSTDLGDDLLLALRGPGQATSLVRFNLKTSATQTLISSLRREQKSPFDNHPPMEIPALIADPPRHRIVFVVYNFHWDPALDGLWEYRVDTEKFRKLHDILVPPLPDGASYALGASSVVQDQILLKTPNGYLVYDLAKDAPAANPNPFIFNYKGLTDFPPEFNQWWQAYGNPGSGASFGDGTIAKRLGTIRAFAKVPDGAYPPFAQDFTQNNQTRMIIGDDSGIWVVTPQY